MGLKAESKQLMEKAGVPLVMGSDSGNPLVFHGPSLHHELQLWVQAAWHRLHIKEVAVPRVYLDPTRQTVWHDYGAAGRACAASPSVKVMPA